MSNNSGQKRTVTDDDDTTSEGTPRRKLVRSGHPPPQESETVDLFAHEMNLRKRKEFKELNQAFAAFMENVQIPGVGSREEQEDIPLSVLDPSNEYLRVAAQIEGKYGGVPCEVVAMGSDEMFQLGLDPADASVLGTVPPTLVSRLVPKVRMVAAGGLHSMALSVGGVPYSWGVNDDGTLGRSAEDDAGQSTPLPITGFVRRDGVKEDGQIIQIAAGASHNLFLSLSGAVYQCGMYKDTDSGKFSDMDGPTGTVEGCNFTPVHVFQMPGKVHSIHANQSVNAAILEDYSVVTWGKQEQYR
jgi:Regulator of chromosome condensation (RCC1) repeat